MPNLWTVPDMAQKAGISQTDIRKLIYKGTLKAQKVGRYWRIPHTEGQKWLDHHAKKESKSPPYRVIIDPDYPELTIGDVIDDVEAEEAEVMSKVPTQTTIIQGYLTNLWQMDDGWWLFDIPQVEGNRAQAETFEAAIESANRGITRMRMARRPDEAQETY